MLCSIQPFPMMFTCNFRPSCRWCPGARSIHMFLVWIRKWPFCLVLGAMGWKWMNGQGDRSRSLWRVFYPLSFCWFHPKCCQFFLQILDRCQRMDCFHSNDHEFSPTNPQQSWIHLLKYHNQVQILYQEGWLHMFSSKYNIKKYFEQVSFEIIITFCL